MVTRTGAPREKNFFLFAPVRKDLAQKVKSWRKMQKDELTEESKVLSFCLIACIVGVGCDSYEVEVAEKEVKEEEGACGHCTA